LAMSADNPQAARLLLEHGAEVNARSLDGSSPLTLAAWQGNKQVVRVLLEWGAAADQEDLQAAFRSAHLDNGHNTAPLLRQSGATIGFLEAIAMHDCHQVLHHIVVEQADVNAISRNGQTPLMAAVYAGCLDYTLDRASRIVRLLLEHGADPNVGNGRGKASPLHMSAYFRNAPIARLLMEHGADVNARGTLFSSLPADETPLTIAPIAQNVELLQEMVRRGADVNWQNVYGRTALMGAAQSVSVDVIRLLLENGADVHLRDRQGRTALMYASLGGELEIVALLLASGADANVRDAAGISALQLAQGWLGKGIVERLQDAGAVD
jgi:ankyrin repeat protein